jgi:glycosyltransferase involved in cell wall biosynthesis
MKIGIDGFAFRKNPSGIGKYVLSLTRLLAKNYPDAEFIIYSNKEILLPADLAEKFRRVCDQSIFRYLNPTVWLKFIAGHKIERDSIDYYFSGTGFLPNLRPQVKKISVIHDLNYKIVPKTMGRLHFLSHLAFLKRDVLKSDFVICNSNGTSNKINQYFGKKASTIINPPTDVSYKPLLYPVIKNTLRKYGIDFPYFLSVGTIEPRKNLKTTLNVFVDLIQEHKLKGHKLLLVGTMGWKNSRLLQLCKKFTNDIIFLGYVDEQDLPALYNGATAFLFPSLYEGFGMPVREALRCNTQVITSDTVELRESGYDQAFFINPLDLAEYKNKILEILKGDLKKIQLEPESIDTDKFIRFFIDVEND